MKISKQRLRQIIMEELANENCPMADGPAPEDMDPVGEPPAEDPVALAAELADLAQRLSAALGGTDMVPAGEEEEVVIDMGGMHGPGGF